MTSSVGAKIDARILFFGFLAGFLAVPLFHQVGSLLLYLTVPGRNMPWNMSSAQHVFGVPALLNLSFWGGVWGVAFVFAERWLPKSTLAYLVAAFVFGAILPTAVGWFVVGPIKGQPFTMARVNWTAFFNNGCWGLGTAVILMLLRSFTSKSADRATA